MEGTAINDSRSQKAILLTAWVVILTTSLFKIVLQEVLHYQLSEAQYLGITALIVIAGFALTFAWKTIRPLRPFFGLFIVLVAAQWLFFTQVDRVHTIQIRLRDPDFNTYMLAEQALKLLVTLTVIAYLLIINKKPEAFYLAMGDTAAPVEPVRWLGIKSGEKWTRLGSTLAIFLSLGTLAFLVIAGRPPIDIAIQALPFLPAVLLAAALNAFYEEMTYKASFLSVLVDVVGKSQALLLMAAFFGILHYYGIPYGIVGVLMAGLLGWLLGKSMLETQGLFWAWFLHFLQDVLIFAFLAIGSITPGG